MTISRVELVQTETPHNPEPNIIPYGTTPSRVPIVAPDDDDFPPTRVPEWYHMVHIQHVQVTIHHHNRNQILYLINTTPHLQCAHPYL